MGLRCHVLGVEAGNGLDAVLLAQMTQLSFLSDS